VGRTILVVVGRVSPRAVAWPALRRAYTLTAREVDVPRLIYEGVTARESARRLGISEHTVRRHTESLYVKLGVHSRGEAQRLIRES
jgi:DNA-binding CsgD family transcriptional regulator